MEEMCIRDSVSADGRRERCTTALLGRHNILNIAGAASAAYNLGVSMKQISNAIASLEPVAVSYTHLAYQSGDVTLHAKIKVRIQREIDGEIRSKVISTSVGRLIFNGAIPQDLGFVDRSLPENAFKLEIDEKVTKKTLAAIVDCCYRRHEMCIRDSLYSPIMVIMKIFQAP